MKEEDKFDPKFVDASKEFFAKMMVKGIENKQDILYELIGFMLESDKVKNGLAEFHKIDAENASNEVLLKMVKTLSKIISRQAESTHLMTGLLLAYVSCDDFAGDAARVANKLGMGQEAMKQLWQNKLKGL